MEIANILTYVPDLLLCIRIINYIIIDSYEVYGRMIEVDLMIFFRCSYLVYNFSGKHLALFGIHPSDTRDRHLRGLFHGYSLQTLLWGIARPGSYFTRALYPPGHDCCSPRSITFSTSEPDKMYTVNYMLYHLHVYPGPGIFGSGPAPTPVPEEEVWDIFFYDGTLPLAFKERCGTIFLVCIKTKNAWDSFTLYIYSSTYNVCLIAGMEIGTSGRI